MVNRVYNFSAGPSVLPEPVLEEAREALLSLGETGIGILEHSHRGAAFREVCEQAEAACRELAGIPDDYRVLFLQGGASLQFCMLPMNFLPRDSTADYLLTGAWSQKAVREAERYGQVHVVCSSEAQNFTRIPAERSYSRQPVYVHFTSNNTIHGTQFREPPQPPQDAFLACDASSDIFSRPIDVAKFGIIYAGAQKNLGPSGVTLVIIRDDLVKQALPDLPTMLSYRTHAESGSLFNTPSTFSIYVMGLVFQWIKQQGGLTAIEERNQAKADMLYMFLDESRLFRPTADRDSRSLMNVTFVTGDAELDAQFLTTAEQTGLCNLKGHRSVGGMRASLYNAFAPDGVTKLVDVMRQFEGTVGNRQ